MPPKAPHTGGRVECWATVLGHFKAEVEKGQQCVKCDRVLKNISRTRMVKHVASDKKVDSDVRERAAQEVAKRKTPQPAAAAPRQPPAPKGAETASRQG